MFKITPRIRIQEGASWEDIQEGDCYETGYEICDSDGEIIYDFADEKTKDHYEELNRKEEENKMKLDEKLTNIADDIIWYSKCTCGAITIQTSLGTYSCKQKNFHKFFPNVDLRKYKTARAKQEIYCCDYCVNHYGLDLCSCGSGGKVNHCDCGSTKPMQVYGQYEKVIAEDSPFFRR